MSSERSLSITVLGCSGTFPGPDNGCSGYLVRADDTAVLWDLGPGTLSAVQRHCDIAALDAVVVSHEHADHWVELAVLRNAARHGLDLSGIPVVCPAGVVEAAAGAFDVDDGTFAFDVVADGAVRVIGDVTLDFSRTDHPPETLAVRARAGGRSLVYSADTGPGWSVAAFGEPVDVAVWEATFDQAVAGVHTSPDSVGRAAADAGVGRLVLTHLLPGTDADAWRRRAAAQFAGVVEMAVPGATFEA